MRAILVFLFLFSSRFGYSVDINWEAGIGAGTFDDLQVPYAAGTVGLPGEPRADGTYTNNDSSRRIGTTYFTRLSFKNTLSQDLFLLNDFSFMQIGSIVSNENLVSSSFDRFGLSSYVMFKPLGHLFDYSAGYSISRTDWRVISTAHLLDSFSFIAGIGTGSLKKLRFDLVGEQLIIGRFAWEQEAFDLTPTKMKNVELDNYLLKTRISFLAFSSLTFSLAAEMQKTRVLFNNLPEAYRDSGLAVSLNTPQSKEFQLSSTNYTIGFSRKF
jgi:hypothetical protein